LWFLSGLRFFFCRLRPFRNPPGIFSLQRAPVRLKEGCGTFIPLSLNHFFQPWKAPPRPPLHFLSSCQDDSSLLRNLLPFSFVFLFNVLYKFPPPPLCTLLFPFFSWVDSPHPPPPGVGVGPSALKRRFFRVVPVLTRDISCGEFVSCKIILPHSGVVLYPDLAP